MITLLVTPAPFCTAGGGSHSSHPHSVMDPVKRVAVITGSTRPRANCKAVSLWAHSICRAREPVKVAYEITDLADWNLPLFDEPGIPAVDPPVHEHTKAWSKKIASMQGFVFVTPQYNWGYPAALKNALDFLYREWSWKPAGIVAYGGRGGGKSAEQLKQVLTGLRMQVLPGPVLLTITKEQQQYGIDFDAARQDFACYTDKIHGMADSLEQELCQPAGSPC